MSGSNTAASNQEVRLSIRIDPARKAVIARAAKQHGVNLSQFVVENAYQLAKELQADEGTISLKRHQVESMFEILDQPPEKSVAAVRRLLSERSILDD